MAVQDTATKPTRSPDQLRKFLFHNTDANNNKYWNVEYWQPEGVAHYVWGRVGDAGQEVTKLTSPSELQKKIQEKFKKGYKELQLHQIAIAPVVTAGPTTTGLHSKVIDVCQLIFREANEAIAKYLQNNVRVENLSKVQIDTGRNILGVAQQQIDLLNKGTRAAEPLLKSTMGLYFSTIPTQLPRKIDADLLLLNFKNDIQNHLDALDQMEAALATTTTPAPVPGGVNQSILDVLGARLEYVASNDSDHKRLCDKISHTHGRHMFRMEVRDIFRVVIPNERKCYETSGRGKNNRQELYHGTRSPNVRHILRSGLTVPRVYTNGWMFGAGIYFADQCTKSAQYCSSSQGTPHFMFLADVDLGRQFVAPGPGSWREAPSGYDSVWGKAGESRVINNEFIVYTQGQQTIRYLITFDRR